MRNKNWSTLDIGTTFESICLLFNICKYTNSVDPDHTAPIGAV